MDKIKIAFDSHSFNLKVLETMKRANELNRAISTIKKITDGEINEIDMDKIDSYLNTKTGFKNAFMSADALGLKKEYEALIGINTDSEYLTKGKEYKLDESALKEAYTSYMKPETVEVYNKLEKGLMLLKELNPIIMQSINRNWEVDKRKLNNIVQLMNR